jgi:hypothetical protein
LQNSHGEKIGDKWKWGGGGDHTQNCNMGITDSSTFPQACSPAAKEKILPQLHHRGQEAGRPRSATKDREDAVYPRTLLEKTCKPQSSLYSKAKVAGP